MPPMEGIMEATTIAVIVLAILFLGGMTALMIVRNTPPKTISQEVPKKRE